MIESHCMDQGKLKRPCQLPRIKTDAILRCIDSSVARPSEQSFWQTLPMTSKPARHLLHDANIRVASLASALLPLSLGSALLL